MNFKTDFESILQKVEGIDPEKYGWSRNYIDGAVTRLSPYISRGVISTKMIFDSLVKRGFDPPRIQKFIQELTWRDYWQQIWIEKGNDIDRDLKHPQPNVANHGVPSAVLNAETGIEVIDKYILEFYKTGYLHNHVRMYLAAIACNMGQSHWFLPAKWMYYHLLDADWASNALSWQWVAGANSNKKYVANQENINKYCHVNQRNTFLDIPYEGFTEMFIPQELQETKIPDLITPLPNPSPIDINRSKATLIYNIYNLDPNWKTEIEANRILLLEPSHFKKYPVSKKVIDFILGLSKNIDNCQVFVGEFEELQSDFAIKNVFFKEHPTNGNYYGTEENRDWIFSVKGFYPSFFAYWKKCKKELT